MISYYTWNLKRASSDWYFGGKWHSLSRITSPHLLKALYWNFLCALGSLPCCVCVCKATKAISFWRTSDYIANYVLLLPKIFINISRCSRDQFLVENNLIRKLLHLSPWSFAIFRYHCTYLRTSSCSQLTHGYNAMHCNEIVSEKINFFPPLCMGSFMMKEFLQGSVIKLCREAFDEKWNENSFGKFFTISGDLEKLKWCWIFLLLEDKGRGFVENEWFIAFLSELEGFLIFY